MVTLSESVIKNCLKRPLAEKSWWRHIRLAIKPRYLGNHASQIKSYYRTLSGSHGRSFRICVLGMTLNCIHTDWCPWHDVKLHPHFIVTGSFLYWCVMRPASQRFFIHNCIHHRILIISNLVTFLGTNSLSVLMCSKAVNQSINQSFRICHKKSPEAPPSGEIMMTSYPPCNQTSLSRKPCIPDKNLL